MSFAGASCSTILLLDLLGVLRHLMPTCSSFQIFRDCIKVQAVAFGFSPTPVASIQPFLLAIRLLVFACIFFFPNMVFYMFRLLFLKAPAKGFSQRTAANFNFSLHLHNISYFLSVPNIIYIIYINFMYITFILYIIYRCSMSTYLLQNSYNVICAGVTQEFLHQSYYTGVVTQELLCFIGVNF